MTTQQRSLKFSNRKGGRFGWFRVCGNYVPPIFSFLTNDEWDLLEEWFEDTEIRQLMGECNISFMSILQGFVMGNNMTGIVQLGHYAGYSTLLLGFMLRKMEKRNSFITIDIDLFCCEYTQKWVKKAGLEEYVSVKLGDSCSSETVSDVKTFLQKKPTIILIDASHQYDSTSKELDIWYEYLQDGGFMFLHDTSTFATTFDNTRKGGVKRAYDEWIVRNPSAKQINIYTENLKDEISIYKDPCGIGIIQKPSPKILRYDPLTNVVIVNWNGEKFLSDCLGSLSRQTYQNYEVIVVDNASADGSVELIREKFPWVRLIILTENTEFARGNNIGFKECNGKYIIALNADTYVPTNFIEEFVKIAEADEKIGAVGCRINTKGSFTRYASVFFNNGLISGPREESVLSNRVYCLAPCGAAVLYRKTVLDELGGFDEDFVTNWEDHDLGFRIYLSGYVCVHIPNITIDHYGGGAYGEKLSPERITIMTKNKLMTYFKNVESKRLLWTLFVAMIYDAGANIVGKDRFPISFIRAILQFSRFATKSIDKRKKIQSIRKTTDNEILSITNGYTLWKCQKNER